MFHLKFSRPIRLFALAFLLLAFIPGHHSAECIHGRQFLPAYIARGNQVAQRYDDYGKRLDKYYASLAAALKQIEPQFLMHPQPREPIQYGYQLLPAITHEASVDS